MPPNRGPSGGPWGRLKPVDVDALDSIGLPSKGDTRSVSPARSGVRSICQLTPASLSRLLDAKTQERYYTKIIDRYLSFCSDAGDRDSLLQRFASLKISDRNGPTSSSLGPTPSILDGTKDLAAVIMALRKLREGIVASKRADDFAIQAYLFCIRLAVLVKQPESYHPAILHLLRFIHRQHPLTSVEFQEVVGYLVLDTVCRRGDLSEAYILRHGYKLRDTKVDAVLAAVARDNWVAFRRIKRSVDGHKSKLMELAEDELRLHTLKCFGRTYLHVDVEYLEKSTGKTWAELKGQHAVGWELDGRKVIIRKMQART
jgi:hypothetical protein